MVVAQALVVAVAVDPDERLESRYLRRSSESAAEIARMPDLVDRREEIAELGGKDAVRIGNQADQHQRKWK